jgi:hypothetical protein
MNKYIPSFHIWEAAIPKEVELYNLDKKKWELDSDATDKFRKKREIPSSKIYRTKDEERNLDYTFKTWLDKGYYQIVLVENNKIVFVVKYVEDDVRYYDQDCQSILGFKIKF